MLYLLFFWPSLFRRETGKGGGWDLPAHVAEMLPWIIAIALIGSTTGGLFLTLVGSGYVWDQSGLGVQLGIALGVAFGMWFGEAFAVALSMALGVAVGVAFGVTASEVGLGVAFGAGVGMAGAISASGAPFAVGARVGFGVLASLGIGVAVGGINGLVLDKPGSLAGGAGSGFACLLAFLGAYFRLLTYPVDAGLSVISSWQRGLDPRRAWRWCPARWNETIWLPLPGLVQLLVRLVLCDREVGLGAITFLATERPLQRRAMRAALLQVAIVDVKASSLPEIAAAARVLDWWAANVQDLAEGIERVVARFERIAQLVDQYLALRSEFRRDEVLNVAASEVEELRRSLNRSTEVEAPAFLQVVNEWRRPLVEELDRRRAQPARQRETPNPFVFGNPLGESNAQVFTGRSDIVRLVEASLLGASHAPTLLLHGARRMGKTSIVNQLPRLLGPDFSPTKLDCQNPAVRESPAAFFRYLARAVSEGLGRRSVRVQPLTATELALEPYGVFNEWLYAAQHAAGGRIRILVCLDEYEHLQEALDMGWGGNLFSWLRYTIQDTIQNRPPVAFMFVGAHTFAELGPAWTAKFINARRIRVSFLTPSEILPLLTSPIPEFDLTYARGAIETIIDATRGHPFLTQAVAFDLVQYMNEQGHKEATVADAELAIGRALESSGEYLANVWNDIGPEGRAILSAIVTGHPMPDFPRGHRWLVDHDVLGEEGRFRVPMIEQWVRQKALAGTAAYDGGAPSVS